MLPFPPDRFGDILFFGIPPHRLGVALSGSASSLPPLDATPHTWFFVTPPYPPHILLDEQKGHFPSRMVS